MTDTSPPSASGATQLWMLVSILAVTPEWAACQGVCEQEAAPDQQRCSGLQAWPEYRPYGVRGEPDGKEPESPGSALAGGAGAGERAGVPGGAAGTRGGGVGD